MISNQESNLTSTAVAGLAGGAAGWAVGASKVKAAMEKLDPGKVLKPSDFVSVDTYVNAKQNLAFERLPITKMSQKQISKTMQKIKEKAVADFGKLETLKKSKIKWAAGLAIAGLALGKLVDSMASKKTEA